ncbi:hypothetical protein TNCV_3658521 [Trichonephila clavipes]|nr:hypothetical protein TNCV_3658521 [Trichonephila clavipes]
MMNLKYDQMMRRIPDFNNTPTSGLWDSAHLVRISPSIRRLTSGLEPVIQHSQKFWTLSIPHLGSDFTLKMICTTDAKSYKYHLRISFWHSEMSLITV